ncbi:PTS fructose transporter subunit IID [Streptococcus penaeicida]|uniref:PTS fructose transporter subunit IID n=1 Tax=Streptococcus penaeicida TaxID=1765960 RepID=A0A2N8LDV4_9STRE|nr:PTS system mannose/fructose/sorbose family transporter subunit IID [Streptococcus penaeicida]PND48341.1 PTS fructose transporter subunit IID [Streptococcus penaeicida]
MTKSNYQLTKEDFKQINKRSLFTFQWGWNYERMQGSGYLYMILPQLRKIYGDNTPELKKMMKVHTQFFNTSNFFHTIITGIDLALEESEGTNSKDAVNGVKTGLMGPFAPIGDSVFVSLIPAIMGSIAAGLAKDGVWSGIIGILMWISVQMLIDIFRWKQLEIAYKEGTKLVTTMRDKLSSLVDAASVMGVFMVGALIATMINFQFTAAPKIGAKEINIQDLLNTIFPRLVPAIFTAAVFWLLGRKGMTPTKAIFIIIIFAILMSYFKILGV